MIVNNMKIGIDASRANSDQKTGVEWYAYFLIQELKMIEIKTKIKTEDEITFVLYSDKPLKGELARLPEGWSSKVLKWPPNRLWTQIRLSLEMLINPPDVLFIPAHVFPIIHPKKTVMMVHDVAAARFPQSYNWFERWYSLWSAKYAVKKLWRVIVPSQFTKNELQKETRIQGYKDTRISVVHHGYDTRYRKIEDKIEIEEVLKKYGIEKPFIMTIGRLEEKKNTKRIVEAFNLLKRKNNQSSIFNLQLLLVGKPGYGYDKVKKAIESSRFRDDIITPGWIDEEDLPYLMNAAEVFVFPSLYEGFGMPILEALACGTPVVASKQTSLEEVGADAAEYVDAGNSEDIARAISRLLTDENFKNQSIQKGLQRATQFSWETCAQKTLSILLQNSLIEQ